MPTPVQPEWTRERIEMLITDKIEEDSRLDYKAAGALNRAEQKKVVEITKDVSAFAHSDGGRIIYGVKEFEDKNRKHLPEKIDPIDGRDYSREWLDQIIGQISPRIEGVQIFPARVGPDDWHVCYVVEIPKSLTAHQARDLRYYKRYNFQSEPMQDYEIRDVMNRCRHPKLDFKLKLVRTSHMTVAVVARVFNLGSVVPKQYGLRVFLPTTINGMKLYREGLILQNVEGKNYWRFFLVGTDPLFPSADAFCEAELPQAPMMKGYEPVGEHVICTLYADEMPPIERKIPADTGSDWQ
jgi:Putative DNA-binding domain